MGAPENPPAFPQQCADALDVGMVHEGMTLRDWFAGQALAQVSSDIMRDPQLGARKPSELPGIIAKAAYQIADALLAARQETGK